MELFRSVGRKEHPANSNSADSLFTSLSTSHHSLDTAPLNVRLGASMTATAYSEQKIYHPGHHADTTGVYRALHLRHRMPHELTVIQGEVFPQCKKCGDRVRFELVHAAPRLKGDVDLLLMLCAFSTAALALACSH